jgi:hypothetical protein
MSKRARTEDDAKRHDAKEKKKPHSVAAITLLVDKCISDRPVCGTWPIPRSEDMTEEQVEIWMNYAHQIRHAANEATERHRENPIYGEATRIRAWAMAHPGEVPAWRWIHEPTEEEVITIDMIPCANHDFCWYKAHTDRLDGFDGMYRLKGTHLRLCKLCKDDEFTESWFIHRCEEAADLYARWGDDDDGEEEDTEDKDKEDK